ncbi:MAG: ABC transporter permease [Halanaerobiales bacterium]
MKAWWELFKKEISSLGFFTMVVLLLIFAWELFLFYKIDSWTPVVAFGLGFLPFSFFPLLILWLGYNGFRQEWKDDTNYFLLSIPRRGWEISLAKLAASMSFYIVVTLLTVLFIFWFHQGYIQREILATIPEGVFRGGFITDYMTKMTLVYIISALFTYIVAQFSQLVSLFFDRFRGFITIVVYLIVNYVIYRGATLLSPLFNWLPDFPVRAFNETGMGLVQRFTFYVGSGPIIAIFLLIIGLFFSGAWLLEKQLEV